MRLDDEYFMIYTFDDIDYSFCRNCFEKGTIKKSCGHSLCNICFKNENCPVLFCDGKWIYINIYLTYIFINKN